ncbi:MAG: HesA/MoeB/ThiF family protein [Bacteroidia bacterium]
MTEERYSRQVLLSQVGEEGQNKLRNSKVLIVGLGGLGCPVAQYLASSGIGFIGLADGDKVELSNLARQPLYGQDDIGKAKAEVAALKLRALNNQIQIEAVPEFIIESNSEQLLESYDVIVDCTDNYATRYLLSDTSEKFSQALVFAALYKWEGQLGVLNYRNGPSYRDLFPDEEAMQKIPTCVEVGVIASLTGIIGSMQANEVIKIVLGLDQVMSNKLLTFNALSMSTYITNHKESEIHE